MAEPVSYQYGDSSDSPIEFDYIEFVRRMVDALVELSLLGDRIRGCRVRRASALKESDAALESLRVLGAGLHKFLSPQSGSPDETPTSRCANAIDRTAADLVRAEQTRVREQVEDRVAADSAEETGHRRACIDALEPVLMDYELPDAAGDVHLRLSREAGYHGRLTLHTSYGVVARLELRPADAPMFARPLKAAGVADSLSVSVQLPEKRRRTTVKLGRLVIAAIDCGPSGTAIQLQTQTGSDADRWIARVDPHGVELGRLRPRATQVDAVELDDAATATVRRLAAGVEAAAREAARRRAALVELTVDDDSVLDDADPIGLVDRVIGAMTTTVQTIASRSQSTTELVLRRRVANARREEIFVSYAELSAKLDNLPAAHRRRFASLGVDGDAPGARAGFDELSDPSIEIIEE